MTAGANLLAPEAQARRNGRAALRLSIAASAALAALLLTVHGLADWRLGLLRARRVAEKTAAGEARLADLRTRTLTAEEGLGHLEATTSSRGRVPRVLAWLGSVAWEGEYLTEVRVDPATGRTVLAGLVREAALADDLALRLSASGCAGAAGPAETKEQDVQGRRLVGFRIQSEGRP